MPKTYRELYKEHRLGYYGMLAWMHILQHDYNIILPDVVWRIYWFFQPLRCLLGWHNWYDVLAGEAISCTCWRRPFKGYRHWIYMQYRFRPWLIDMAAAKEDAESRLRMLSEIHTDQLIRFVKHMREEHDIETTGNEV